MHAVLAILHQLLAVGILGLNRGWSMGRLIIVLIFIICLPAYGLAVDSIRGSADWSYAKYSAETGNGSSYEASHFSQQYSLVYSKETLINGGRAGKYKLSLGYEWSALAARTGSEDHDFQTGKILYDGELIVAPGGLPFRLDLYSKDTHKTLWIQDSHNESPAAGLRPSISDNLQNGQHVLTGARLMLGIRNGSYLGAYRDMLSRFPKLLMDYKEHNVCDLKSDTPSHYRLRHLAFVSLNKKDNWFHYRFSDYKDYLNPDSDYWTRSYMLGTIDHVLVRKWINLTNWIKISADGTFSQDKFMSEKEPEVDKYDLNLFAVTRRQDISASSYTHFLNRVEGASHEKYLTIPLYYSQVLNRNTSLHSRLVLDNQRTERVGTSGGTDDYSQVFTLQLGMMKTRPMTLTSTVEVEHRQGDEGDGQSGRLTFEASTNSRYSAKNRAWGEYSIGLFQGRSETGEEIDFVENKVGGSFDAQFGPSLTVGGSQTLTYGQGRLDGQVFSAVVPASSIGIGGGSAATFTAHQGEVFTSNSMLYVDWYKQVTSSRLSAATDYLHNGTGTDQNMTLQYEMKYVARTLSVGWRSQLRFNSNGSQLLASDPNSGGETNVGEKSKWQHNHDLSLSYAPSRAWHSTAHIGYSESSTAASAALGQSAKYSLYTSNGIVREWAYFLEKFEWESLADGLPLGASEGLFQFQARFMPTKMLSLGLHEDLDYSGSFNVDKHTYGGDVSVDFELLQASLLCEFAETPATELQPVSHEQRWQFNLKKIF